MSGFSLEPLHYQASSGGWTTEMFAVEIWGTVAQWGSAVGTSSAVGAAAYYYIHDKRREAKAQAAQIHAELRDRQVIITNNSTQPIFDLYIHIGLRGYGAARNGYSGMPNIRADHGPRDQIAEKMQLVTFHRKQQHDFSGRGKEQVDHHILAPEEAVSLSADRTSFEYACLIFRDSHGQHWSYDLDTRGIFKRDFIPPTVKRLRGYFPSSEFWYRSLPMEFWTAWRNGPYYAKNQRDTMEMATFVAGLTKYQSVLNIDPAQYILEITPGAAMRRDFVWKAGATGDPVDLADLTAVMVLIADDAPGKTVAPGDNVIDISRFLTVDAKGGIVSVALPAHYTAGLDAQTGRFKLSLHAGEGCSPSGKHRSGRFVVHAADPLA